MKAGTEDRVEGKFHEAKGDLKARAAKTAGNPEQEAAWRPGVNRTEASRKSEFAAMPRPHLVMTSKCRTAEV